MSTNSRKSGGGRSAKGRLVAVKMTLRGGASVGVGADEAETEEREREKERTRVAFVREVEVLRVSYFFKCSDCWMGTKRDEFIFL